MKRFSALLPVLVLLLAAVGCREAADHEDHESHAGHDHSSHRHEAGVGAPASEAGVVMCAEHGVPEAECGICRPDLAGRLTPGEGLKVRLPGPDSARLAGVETGTPSRGPAEEAVVSYAEIAFDPTRMAQIVAPVGGIVQEVTADLGYQAAEKEVVARIWSATIAEAVARAVLTHQTLDRERRLRANRVTSEQSLQEAEAAHTAACQQLRTLGFTEDQIDELGREPLEKVLMEVRAPFPGEIIDRFAVRGAWVEPGRPLFTLADRTMVWAMIHLPETTLGRVREGQRVELTVDAFPGRTFTGRLTWIGPEIDERTRMARARAEVENPEGVLRARMFARARILTRRTDDALLLPAGAVQELDGRRFVFIRLAEDLFEARTIATGAHREGNLEVLAGLNGDESVAVSGSFALKSQLLLSRLGAGCAHE